MGDRHALWAVEQARGGPCTTVVDGDGVLEFARVTLDDDQFYRQSGMAPPLYAVVAAWPATMSLLTAILEPGDLAASLHYRQEMQFSRLLRIGEQVESVAEFLGASGTSFGTTVGYRISTWDSSGAEIVTVHSTIIVRSLRGGGATGRLPARTEPLRRTGARSLGEVRFDVPLETTHRFSEVTGDRQPVHTDERVARESGFPGLIMHGMCTLAMCASAVVRCSRDCSAADIARLSTTFPKPLFSGRPLTVDVFEDCDAGELRRVGFVASQGRLVGTRAGVVELRPT